MFNPDVDDSEPLNPGEDGSGYYNKLADSPEFGRYNEGIVTANKGFSDEDKRATLLTKTPTKQNVELVDEQYSKKGTPKRKTQKTPSKLRFNVAETQPSPAAKKSNTTKHTRSASTGQQYIQPSPPPSPKFKHPYQQLKGGDTVDRDDGAEQSTGYMNISVDGSPQLNNFDTSKGSSDSPVHVDISSPVTSFFGEALQSTPLTKHSMPSNFAVVNPSLTVASGNNSVVTETPVSMVTPHGTNFVWGLSPQKPVQQDNSNMAPSSEWVVSAELREKFTTQFRDLKPENGLLYGDKARVFFLKSKLQSKDLSAIWKLADVDRDGKLSEEEFCIAMKMVLVRRKGYDIPSTIPEPLLPSKPSVRPTAVPPLLPNSSVHTTAIPNARDDAMTTAHLPALPTLQHQQLKSQTLPTGMKPITSSKYPTQLPLLPPPSRRQFTRTNTGGTVDSPVTSRLNGNDEQVNSPTDHHGPSRTTGLSHSNWPTTLTSDSGKPLRFNSNIEHIVPLPPTPSDAPSCPIDNSNMEKNHVVNVATGNNKHKTSGPPIVDLGPKPEVVQLPTDEPSVKQPTEAHVKTKSKKTVIPVSKDDSGDEESFGSDEDETSALYAVVKPRGAKGKSGESKTHKHSTLRSSNSFKKHKPKPPPKPEPYSVSKYKKKSSSPSPAPVDATAVASEGGHVNPVAVDVQEHAATTSTDDQAKVETKESSVVVDDPSALYAKVIKKKPSMDLMEPIPLGQDIVPLEQVMENNVIPSVTVDKDDVNATIPTATSSSSSEVTGASKSATNITTATADTSDTTDGLFGHKPVQLISMTRTESDSITNTDTTTATVTTTTTTTTTTVATATGTSDDKPVPLPRKKHHRSSSLDLNKMFQKKKSAEQLAVSPDSLTKDLPSAVPPKPPPKPRKPKPVSNLENELMPQISRSASLDSINSAAGNMGMVSAHRDFLEKNIPASRTPPVMERFGAHDQGQHKKKKPLLPPHLRSNQSDTPATGSNSSNDLVASSNSQEHTEKRDKAEIQKNIKALREETKALMQLNHNLQQMLMRLTEERILLSAKLESSTKRHLSS